MLSARNLLPICPAYLPSQCDCVTHKSELKITISNSNNITVHMYAVAARDPEGSTSQLLANVTAAALLLARWRKNGKSEGDMADAKKAGKVYSRKAGGGSEKVCRGYGPAVRLVAWVMTCLLLGTAFVVMTCQGDSCDERRVRLAMIIVMPVRDMNLLTESFLRSIRNSHRDAA